MTEPVDVDKESFEEWSKKIGIVSSIEDWAKKRGLNAYVAVHEHREIKEPIVSEIKLRGVSEILDVGCGYGFLMGRLNESCPGISATGTDLSRFQIINAMQRGIRSSLVVCCAEYMPFRSDFFDFVVCSEVIEHVASKELSLLEMERITKKGGYLCITTDNPLSIYRKILDYLRKKTGREEKAHQEYISLASLIEIIPKNIRLYKTMFICPYSLLPGIGPFGLDAVGKAWVRLTEITQKLPYVRKQFCNKYIVFALKERENRTF